MTREHPSNGGKRAAFEKAKSLVRETAEKDLEGSVSGGDEGESESGSDEDARSNGSEDTDVCDTDVCEICKKSDDANCSHHKIQCDDCDKWFHAACLPDNGGFKRRAKRILDMPEGQEKDDAEWKCMQCKPA